MGTNSKAPKRRQIIFRVVITISLAAMAAGAIMIFKSLYEYKIGANSYRELKQFVILPVTVSEDVERGEEPNRWPQVDFEALWKINPDVVAWLYCEDTAINYPVVQRSDNEYYLRRLLDGTWNIAGTLFVDANNQPGFVDHNTIIYGHNLKDGSMFRCISEYKRQEYFDEHPVILLVTPEENYEIRLFAGYVADPKTPEDTWSTWFSNREAFQGWIDSTQARSTFSSDVEPTITDRFITLSTCSYEWDDARYVVVGVLLENL